MYDVYNLYSKTYYDAIFSLKNSNCRNNRVTTEASVLFSKGLAKNESITVLKVSFGYMTVTVVQCS